jgi:hypothetical protein
MTFESCFVPAYTQISDDPELAPLAVLDFAMATTRATLHAHLPELGDPEPPWADNPPDPQLFLAQLILLRIDELRALIDNYRRCNDARHARILRSICESRDEIF